MSHSVAPTQLRDVHSQGQPPSTEPCAEGVEKTRNANSQNFSVTLFGRGCPGDRRTVERRGFTQFVESSGSIDCVTVSLRPHILFKKKEKRERISKLQAELVAETVFLRVDSLQASIPGDTTCGISGEFAADGEPNSSRARCIVRGIATESGGQGQDTVEP